MYVDPFSPVPLLPAQDLPCSAPKLTGPVLGVTCRPTPLPCVPAVSPVTPLEISAGPLGVVSWGWGSSYPTHQEQGKGQLANQGTKDTEVLCQWSLLIAITFPGFPFGIWQIVLGIWPCDRNPYLPALPALKSEGLR